MKKLPEMPEALLAGDSARRKLVSRALAGAVLIAALLGLLSYFDQTAKPRGEAVVATISIPPVGPAADAGAQQTPPTDARPPDQPPTLEQAAVALAPEVEPEESRGPEIADPAERVADAPPTSAGTRAPGSGRGRLVLQGDVVAAEPDLAAPAPQRSAPPLATRAGQGRFLLQLGVFSTPENAQALYEDLRQRGIPARLETRVVAGPFADKAAAEAARRKLLSAGLSKGIVVRDTVGR